MTQEFHGETPKEKPLEDVILMPLTWSEQHLIVHLLAQDECIRNYNLPAAYKVELLLAENAVRNDPGLWNALAEKFNKVTQALVPAEARIRL